LTYKLIVIYKNYLLNKSNVKKKIKMVFIDELT